VGPREWYDELPSTQDRALALARSGAPAGTRVVARTQTRGRGRLDHRWSSPPGSLYLSIVLPRPRASPTLLPLALGAHLADALDRRWGVRPRLKWPNDLLITDGTAPARKLAGILVDTTPSAAVAGIGVNVRLPPEGSDPELAGRRTSLEEWARPCPELEEVESLVTEAALDAARALDSPAGTVATRELCRNLLYGVGRPATVDGRPAGTIATVGPDGELWLDVDGERMTISAGDLRVEEP
jgi:BirA family transcriptional regulator, biotin operon repressor / biotin---[acetyl-CoA-carboxylase] ligase